MGQSKGWRAADNMKLIIICLAFTASIQLISAHAYIDDVNQDEVPETLIDTKRWDNRIRLAKKWDTRIRLAKKWDNRIRLAKKLMSDWDKRIRLAKKSDWDNRIRLAKKDMEDYEDYMDKEPMLEDKRSRIRLI